MDDRTCKIILCSKGRCGNHLGTFDIINYMSHECECDKEVYTESTLYSILFAALCDYIDGCDRPSVVLRNILEAKKFNFSTNEQIVSAFAMANVMDGKKYINGFTEEQYDRCIEYLKLIKE